MQHAYLNRILRSVCDGLAQLVDPPTYLTHSAFIKLRNELESAAGQFTACWPNALSDADAGDRITDSPAPASGAGESSCGKGPSCAQSR